MGGVIPFQQGPKQDLCLCSAPQVRVAFEEFSGHAGQMLSRLEEMQETVARKDFPQDLEGARRMIEEHAALKKKVIKAPIEELDTEGQRYESPATRLYQCPSTLP